MADESNKDERHIDSKPDDPGLEKLRVDLNLFIEYTARAMGSISSMPRRPTESDEDDKRYAYWTDEQMAKKSCDKLIIWSRQASKTHEAYWEYYLTKMSIEAGDGRQSLLSRIGGIFKKPSTFSWTAILNDFMKNRNLIVIASIPESTGKFEKEKYNLCMKDDTHRMYNVFKHFQTKGENPSKKERATRDEFLGIKGKKFCDKPLDQVTSIDLNDYASKLIDLLNTVEGINIDLSEKLQKEWGEKYGAMNHRIQQVQKRLQELEWTVYEPPTDTLKAEIVEKIEDYLLTCIHGDGGIGKTALAYDIIRDNCRGVSEYDLRGEKQMADPFDAIIMLTTRTKEQGVYRTINPGKGITTSQSRENEASFHIQIKDSFDEMIRVVIEAGRRDEEQFLFWSDKDKQREIALKILQEKRYLVLIDNFEDVQRKKIDADGEETEEYEQKEIMEQFTEFFNDFRKGGTKHNNSRFLITTRIDDGVGQENQDLPYLSMGRAARLANKRYLHLYSTIREPYTAHEIVMRDIQSLRTENEEGDDQSIKSAFGEDFTQIWGHPLVIMLVVWRLADLGHQAMQKMSAYNRRRDNNPDSKEKAPKRLIGGSTLSTVIAEISEGKGSQLFESISDLSVWATSKSLGLLPQKWLSPFWTLVSLDWPITDDRLKRIYLEFNDTSATGSEISDFRRFLDGSTWMEHDRGGEMRFSRGSLRTLRFALPERLADLSLPDQLAIEAIINEYKPEELGVEETEHYQSISANEMKEEMMQYLESTVIPRKTSVVEEQRISPTTAVLGKAFQA